MNVKEIVQEHHDYQFVSYLHSISPDTTCYLVGGCVRDIMLGILPNDIDIVVDGMDYEEIAYYLRELGSCDMVGRSFGIIKFKEEQSGIEFDIAVPRTERVTGPNHTDFEVNLQWVSVEEDLGRRDFTINAMAWDLRKHELVDPHNGAQDLMDGFIVPVFENTFVEDPLRMLRAIQFASRFVGFIITVSTITKIKRSGHLIQNVSKERVIEELKKVVDKGDWDVALGYLEVTGLLSELFGTSVLNDHYLDSPSTLAELLFKFSDGNVEFLKKYPLSNDLRKQLEALDWIRKAGDVAGVACIFMLLKAYKAHHECTSTTKLMEFDQLSITKLSDLAINGEDLECRGYIGRSIGYILSDLLVKVNRHRIDNNKEELIKFVENYKI